MFRYRFATHKWNQVSLEVLASVQFDIAAILSPVEQFAIDSATRELVTTLDPRRLGAVMRVAGMPANPLTFPVLIDDGATQELLVTQVLPEGDVRTC